MKRLSRISLCFILLLFTSLALPAAKMHFQGQVLTTNGQPVYQPTITVTFAGTAANPTLYSTQAGGALANPFTSSNSDGTYDFWIEGGVYDVDYSSTLFPSSFISPSSLDNVELLPDSWDIRAFGARCDGSTDDRTAIKAALDEADGTGATVRIPAGTCNVNSAINSGATAYSNIRVIGAGMYQSTLDGSGGGDGFAFLFFEDDVELGHFGIEGGLSGAGADTSHINQAIRFTDDDGVDGCDNVYIHDLYIRNATTSISVSDGDGYLHEDWRVIGNRLENAAASTLSLSSLDGFEITGNVLGPSGQSPLKLNSGTTDAVDYSRNGIVDGNRTDRTVPPPLDGGTEGGQGITIGREARDIIISNNYVESNPANNAGDGIALLGDVYRVVVSGNLIKGPGLHGIDAASGVTIVGNIIYHPGTRGIVVALDFDTAYSSIVISDNIIIEPNEADLGATMVACIFLEMSLSTSATIDNIVIANNICEDTRITPRMDYGIQIGAGVGTEINNLLIHGNILDDAIVTSIFLASGTEANITNFKIGQNIVRSGETYTLDATMGMQDCAANEILKRNAGDTAWECAADATGGGGANSFETWNPTSGTSPVASSATDTMIVTGTSPITVTGDSGADSLTFAFACTDCIDSTDYLDTTITIGDNSTTDPQINFDGASFDADIRWDESLDQFDIDENVRFDGRLAIGTSIHATRVFNVFQNSGDVTTPGSFFSINNNATSNKSSWAVQTQATLSNVTTTGGKSVGGFFVARQNASDILGGTLIGGQFKTDETGSRTDCVINKAIGGEFETNLTGGDSNTWDLVTGVKIISSIAGATGNTWNTYKGVDVFAPVITASGSITNSFGLYIADLTGASRTTTTAIHIEAQDGTGQGANTGNINMAGGDWDTGHHKLGAGHIWNDSGTLRWKASDPSSSTDGADLAGAVSTCTAVFTSNSDPSAGTTTTYSPFTGSVDSFKTNVTETQMILPINYDLHDLRVWMSTAPGGSATYTITLQVNGSNNATLQCVVTGAAVVCNDAVGTVSVTAGDRVNWEVVPATTPADSTDIAITVCGEPT